MPWIRLFLVVVAAAMCVWADIWFYSVAILPMDKGMWFFLNVAVAVGLASMALDYNEPRRP